MIQVTPQMRILVALAPADFRKGIDGLARVCREALRSDPFSGCVFVFGNRCRKVIKILVYDGQGFGLCQKRLSMGRFRWWPQNPATATEVLEAYQLPVLLSGGNPAVAKGAPAWRRVDTRV
jgi:transposase